jgi:ATP-dependent Clp endopeptidase proteolytic subunit ClpP
MIHVSSFGISSSSSSLSSIVRTRDNGMNVQEREQIRYILAYIDYFNNININNCRSGARSMTMMPIGVPKVAYRMPGSRGGEWVDIYNRLTRERIIFVGSEIDDELANQIIGVLLYLDNENPGQPIYMYINCPGGSVISGLAIYDTMQHIRSEVVTVNLGLAASMASFLLCAGSRGRRFALPHSRVMIHQPMGGAQGQAEDIRVEASQIMRIRNNIVKLYSLMTGQTVEQVIIDLDRDNFLSAEEALKYGLIDEIVQPNDEKLKQLSLPPPSQAPSLFGELPADAESYQFGKIDVPKGRQNKPNSNSYRK